jgi:CRP/FNR family transcriptional regulator
MVSAAKSCSHYKKGQSIFHEDHIPLGIYCLNKGAIKLTRSNKDGKEQIIRFAREGEFLGYRALIADEPLVATATCIEDTICCFVPKAVFLSLLEKNVQINKHMLKSLCHDLGIADERIQSLAQKSVRERLAETLLFLHKTFQNETDTDENLISVSLPREDIANIVGTATETVIRLLSEFKADKLIDMEGKRIRILHKAALEKISHASV